MPIAVIGIYRARNAERLLRLLERGPAPERVQLWALDEVSPLLSAWTAGVGGGGKFELLNRLWTSMGSVRDHHVVVTDDDVDLRRGSLHRLCRLMDAAGLDLAQPVHGRGSRSSYEFNRHRTLSRARRTTFVEIGPVFAVAPDWVPHVLPFPDSIGMGWGLEFTWAGLQQSGCRLGVVDAVRVFHPEQPTIGYAQEEEEARAQSAMEQAGVTTMREAQHVLGTWWLWQRRPPWLRPEAITGRP